MNNYCKYLFFIVMIFTFYDKTYTYWYITGLLQSSKVGQNGSGRFLSCTDDSVISVRHTYSKDI